MVVSMRVKEACRTEWYDQNLDKYVVCTFKAGAVSPKNEDEERALTMLADAGLVDDSAKDEE